ncbi:hypothetical protein CTI12_AA493040 [Artemisia annua]|uniref:Uncharacterized protein n=1 Tax=Artemisia annua TaxID=35608 RepID=A0A2U1KTJ1_ARTAN|nr:hypothetical protein CTI12_AA493040 [Artemisia annua]
MGNCCGGSQAEQDNASSVCSTGASINAVERRGQVWKCFECLEERTFYTTHHRCVVLAHPSMPLSGGGKFGNVSNIWKKEHSTVSEQAKSTTSNGIQSSYSFATTVTLPTRSLKIGRNMKIHAKCSFYVF